MIASRALRATEVVVALDGGGSRGCSGSEASSLAVEQGSSESLVGKGKYGAEYGRAENLTWEGKWRVTWMGRAPYRVLLTRLKACHRGFVSCLVTCLLVTRLVIFSFASWWAMEQPQRPPRALGGCWLAP